MAGEVRLVFFNIWKEPCIQGSSEQLESSGSLSQDFIGFLAIECNSDHLHPRRASHLHPRELARLWEVFLHRLVICSIESGYGRRAPPQ
jgi:hypothetical protein